MARQGRRAPAGIGRRARRCADEAARRRYVRACRANPLHGLSGAGARLSPARRRASRIVAGGAARGMAGGRRARLAARCAGLPRRCARLARRAGAARARRRRRAADRARAAQRRGVRHDGRAVPARLGAAAVLFPRDRRVCDSAPSRRRAGQAGLCLAHVRVPSARDDAARSVAAHRANVRQLRPGAWDPEPAVVSRFSFLVSRQSAIGNRQSVIGNR
ncbi:hypothetical protein Y030_6074 [Burkholderia pseudomallei MSHR332]|nr:hypothetical protein Y030_6074 [Burkholderia pseudomallei MSHR332]